MAAPALLFDVDGTLWDSYPWYAEVLAGMSGQAATDLQQRLAAGRSIVRLADDCGVPDGRFCRACIAAAAALRLYPGVKKTLSDLKRRGTPCGVVTSLPGRIVKPLLERLNLVGYFQAVVHAGTVRPGKPNPAPLREAAKQMGLGDLADVFYIGDGPADATAARRAGMQFAWVSYGYTDDCPDSDAVLLRGFSEVLAL